MRIRSPQVLCSTQEAGCRALSLRSRAGCSRRWAPLSSAVESSLGAGCLNNQHESTVPDSSGIGRNYALLEHRSRGRDGRSPSSRTMRSSAEDPPILARRPSPGAAEAPDERRFGYCTVFGTA